MEGGGERGQCGPAVRHVQPSDGGVEVRRRRGLGEDGAGAGGERIGNEAVAVRRGAADGGKKHAGCGLAR